MGLTWKEEHLDLVLVPSGLLIMLGYHLFHLQQCLNCPENTLIGYENHNKRAWVARILQVTILFQDLNSSLFFFFASTSDFIASMISSRAANGSDSSRVCSNSSRVLLVLKSSRVVPGRVEYRLSLPDSTRTGTPGRVEAKDRGQAITVINANLSASTSFASISLALSSLIGAWIGSSYHNDYITKTIYGNTSPTVAYVKYISLLACFMIAFACFVQTARCFVDANFLISMPNCRVHVGNVERAVIRGSNFWVVGLRSLYFATNLLLWIFGPIPMFVCSVVTVVLLQYLDKNSTPLPEYGNPPAEDEKSNGFYKEMSEFDGNIENHEGLNGPNGL
ncbi:hypothetical protein OROMI_019873 [Orobanche minor]